MSSPRLFKQLFTFNNGLAAQTTPNLNPDGQILPLTTINVASTAGFTNSGQISFYAANGQAWTLQTITYTGITPTSFTGCTGGTGTIYNYNAYPNPTIIAQSSATPIVTGTWTAPPGVKWVWVTGCGGGGGGGAGASISSTNHSYPLFIWALAGGGGGGQAAVTSSHIVSVTPGVTYPVSIGLGGFGGITNVVWNGAPYIVANLYPNNYGGACWGNPGSAGQSSIFGSLTFQGGQGGRRGEILQRVSAVNQIEYNNINYAGGDDPVGSTQYNKTDPGNGAFPAPFPNPVLGGQTVLGRTYGIWNPPGLASSQYVLDQVLTIGLLNYSQPLVANSAAPGPTNNWLPGSGGAGGGGGGGASNNAYSFGGGGGAAAHGVAGNNFAGAGGPGYYGGGGGGGGGGEGVNYNNTHDGAFGGNGGAGFIEISWIQ
jgi:hypothetical protein